MRSSLIYVLIALVFLIFGLFLLYISPILSGSSLDASEFFEGNLLPELIGFCLEGALFVGVLIAVQEASHKRYRCAIKKEIDTGWFVIQNYLYYAFTGYLPNTYQSGWQEQLADMLFDDDLVIDKNGLEEFFIRVRLEIKNHRALYGSAINLESETHTICWSYMLASLEKVNIVEEKYKNGYIPHEVASHLIKWGIRDYLAYGQFFRLTNLGAPMPESASKLEVDWMPSDELIQEWKSYFDNY